MGPTDTLYLFHLGHLLLPGFVGSNPSNVPGLAGQGGPPLLHHSHLRGGSTFVWRLHRFGSAFLRQLLERDGVLLEVAHPKGSGGGRAELLEDFTTLVATFAGRMYGIRSREAKRRLLAQAQQRVAGDDRSTG
ncbi:MAG: hypothetical protein M0T72_09980 [Candidatus Dormibacteraeota bacterium]|nr:hypothetical protein [Candidatus Dormibacteraeota bacterium]